MIRVSVIVTTYNRAKLLPGLLNKLLNQEYDDFEIIVVNDGSTDNTAAELALIDDKRLRVINKPNGGISDARNAGLEMASGEYVLFIDDDDSVSVDFISSFMREEYHDTDLIIDSYCSQLDDDPPIPTNFNPIELVTSCDTVNYLCGELPDKPYMFFPTGKRFKLSIIRDHGIRFVESVNIGEDRLFVIDYILASGNCRIVNNHKYIMRSQSTDQYRLSKGMRESGWLWRNFRYIYEYLINVNRETGLESVKRYADNYLATRTLDYLFTPYCLGRYKSGSDKEIIKQAADMLSDNVSAENVTRNDARCYLMIIRKSLGLACMIWKFRLMISKLKNNIMKIYE